MNKELNELIEMVKMDRWYYEECKSIAIANGSSELIAYYSNILKHINSLIARIKEGELELND